MKDGLDLCSKKIIGNLEFDYLIRIWVEVAMNYRLVSGSVGLKYAYLCVLHDPVIGYGINYVGTKITQWASLTKKFLPVQPDVPLI